MATKNKDGKPEKIVKSKSTKNSDSKEQKKESKTNHKKEESKKTSKLVDTKTKSETTASIVATKSLEKESKVQNNKVDTLDQEENNTKTDQNAKNINWLRKILIGIFGVIIALVLIAGGLKGLSYYDLRQSRQIYKDYRNLFGETFVFFEQYNYTKLRNEDYLKAETVFFPQLDKFESQINSIETIPVIYQRDSDIIKTEITESNSILREYIQQYKNLLNDAECLAKSNENYNKDFGAFTSIINNYQESESNRVNKAKQYLNTFVNVYSDASNCVQVLDIKSDLSSISQFYSGLNNSSSLYDFSNINYKIKNDNAINSIQSKFLKASQDLSNTFKKYYESYKVVYKNWDSKLTKANSNDLKLFRRRE
jgi:hypothetical protein